MDGLPRGVLVGTVEIVGCLPLKQDDSQAACFEITETLASMPGSWRDPSGPRSW